MRYVSLGLCLAAVLSVWAQTQQPAAAPKTESQAAPKADAKADAKAPPAAEKKAPAPPADPKERTVYRYVYDVNGRTNLDPSDSTKRSGTTTQSEQIFRGSDGRPITAASAQERQLSPTSSEKVIQRYDPTGKPTGKEIVRTEKRPLPDGSVVTIESTYVQDLNGQLQFNQRRTTTEKKSETGGTTTTLVERPSVNGGVQVVQRHDSVETKRGDVTESVTSRRYVDSTGRMTEQERERSVATKAGTATNTETQLWRVGSAGVSGQMDLISRSVSQMTERPDGSQVEDTKVYSTLIGGTTPDLNRAGGQLTLEQESRREKKVDASGKSVETKSTRLRTVAEPSRLGSLVTEEQTTTPTAEGKNIQTVVSERDSNGRIVPVRRESEQVKN